MDVSHRVIIHLFILPFAPLVPTVTAVEPIAVALPALSTQAPSISVAHPGLLPQAVPKPSFIYINAFCVFLESWDYVNCQNWN